MKTMKNLLLVGLALALFTSCEKDDDCIYGRGGIVTRDYTIDNFDEIALYGYADVFLTRDAQTSLRIEGQENILTALNVEVNNGELRIGRNNCFKDSEKLNVFISTPSLRGVKISGLCDVYSSSTFTGTGFDASIDGSGLMELALDVQEFNALISGDGDIVATGKANTQTIRISGIGDMQLFELKGQRGDIHIDGLGNVEINVSEKLDVTVRGSGDIYYLGTPDITQDISGSGNIINANE
jgi:hypothetical protein